jgi:hypothetical protein
VTSNYEAICEENRRRYGTEGAQKSGGLAAGLYDNRTHFIFELLQNAEDALGRRGVWEGPRKVTFALTPTRLALSHFGKPFDEPDVRSVCDIAESTKNEASIGRFGLGFKSVYTVTNLPEIHSGDEDFAIEEYVFPKRVGRSAREDGETQIVLPLKAGDATVMQEITAGLRHLGPGALLFLRHIEEIAWSVEGGASGFYLRNSPETLAPNVKRVTVIGQESGKPEVDQTWLVFHRDVVAAEKNVGRVEIAFSLVGVKDVPDRWLVHPLATSPLVVFFPTVVESHLGFLVQGPFRTTPGRDNIPPADPWNQYLVSEITTLVVEAMRWMRGKGMLDVSALRCLPLDREKFPKDSRFAPMFDAVRQAFRDDALLPTFDGNYVTAKQAKLARTQELRELFSPTQVAALFGGGSRNWLSGDITQDKTPEIRHYLMRELDIDEIRPEKLVPSLNRPFLEAQPDAWVLRLYEFLSGQEKALRRYLDTVPLVRLDDGTHVLARQNGKANAFLPSAISTSFPTMRRSVCGTAEARGFLISLGITEPDPVDDVIWNVLPKYREKGNDVDDATYSGDVERIRAAFSTDSTIQKDKLRTALRETAFVRVVDTGNGISDVARPGEVYIATERLKQLFAGVADVLMVDDEYECLLGEDMRDLLVSCGASRYLTPQPVAAALGPAEKAQIRKEAGLERASWESPPEDFTIRGLAQLLKSFPTLDPADAKAKAAVLWEALADLEGRGSASFYGSYKWGYSHETKTARFDPTFIRTLNQAAWIPAANGELARPSLVVFESLRWKPNPFLLTKISFKPPIIDELAREAGIDPAVLDLLRMNPTLVAELVARIGSAGPQEQPAPTPDAYPTADEPSDKDPYVDAEDLYGDDMPNIPPGTPDPDGGDGERIGTIRNGHSRTGSGPPRGNGGEQGGSGGLGASRANGNASGIAHGKRTPGQNGQRPFISYVGAHPNDDGPDPDGLDQAARMQIEDKAIELIIGLEPTLRRTAIGNPGFDLFEVGSSGQQSRWIEVKSMTGSLSNRPVGLSHAQFECARERGAAYWLYVVEHATDPAKARVLKIQDPVGRARTFTFDRGWAQIAQ